MAKVGRDPPGPPSLSGDGWSHAWLWAARRASKGGGFADFQSGPESAALLARLRAWAGRDVLNERSTETAFMQRFFGHLLTLPTTTESPLRDDILALDNEITTLDQTIQAREATLNAHTYRLYHLTPEEIAMVEGG